jgi:hypothetical protein
VFWSPRLGVMPSREYTCVCAYAAAALDWSSMRAHKALMICPF